MCYIFVNSVKVSSNISCNDFVSRFLYNVCLVFCQSKFNICVRSDMAFIEPMHRNKPNITYLLCTKIVIKLPHDNRPVEQQQESWSICQEYNHDD